MVADICKSLQYDLAACVYEPISVEIERHLEKCLACRDYLRSLHKTREKIALLLPQPNRILISELKASVKTRLYANEDAFSRKISFLLAVASILLIVGTGVIYHSHHSAKLAKTKITLVVPTNKNQLMSHTRSLLSRRGLKAIKFGAHRQVATSEPSRLTWLSCDGLQYLKYGEKKRKF